MPTAPQISRIAINGINELAGRGIVATPAEIVLLHTLGLRCENPVSGERLDLIGMPHRCGNVWLWPITISASIWFTDLARPWFDGHPKLTMYALAFALAHGRGQQLPAERPRTIIGRMLAHHLGGGMSRTLCDLRTREDAAAAVGAWVAGVNATLAELEAAIDAALHIDTPGARAAADAPPADWPAIVRELSLMTGTDPEFWLTRTSADEALKAYLRAVAIDAARRGFNAPVKSAADLALSEFRKAIVAIINDRKQVPA